MISAVISSWRTTRVASSESRLRSISPAPRHRLHARLVFRREGVQRRVAELRVHVGGGELAQQRLGRQIE